MAEMVRLHGPDDTVLRRAASLLARGGLVAYPTETLYGIAADHTNHQALARLTALKGREPGKRLMVGVVGGDAVKSFRGIGHQPASGQKAGGAA